MALCRSVVESELYEQEDGRVYTKKRHMLTAYILRGQYECYITIQYTLMKTLSVIHYVYAISLCCCVAVMS